MDEPEVVCSRCATPLAADATPDDNGWCSACRAAVVRRSTRIAYGPAAVAALLMLWLLTRFGMMESRFVVIWLAIAAAATWLAFKVGRRVAFDVVRSRVRRIRRRQP
jgi:hypothetical protein